MCLLGPCVLWKALPLPGHAWSIAFRCVSRCVSGVAFACPVVPQAQHASPHVFDRSSRFSLHAAAFFSLSPPNFRCCLHQRVSLFACAFEHSFPCRAWCFIRLRQPSSTYVPLRPFLRRRPSGVFMMSTRLILFSSWIPI